MNSRNLFSNSLPVWLLFLLCSLHATAQPNDTLQSILERLTAVEGAKITIEADMTTIVANKKTNQYFPGTLITEDGTTYPIELRPRGKFRRKISEIPPLKIKFKKKELKALGLDTLNEIKLVLPTEDKGASDELIVKEYLIYRMFERLTPASVKARLIRLTIRDTHVEKSRKVMYAILVEDQEETCARLKATPVEDYGLPADSLLAQQAALTVMFEYMIGNTDWEIAMLRNVRLLRSNESRRILVMPYDFDFSGLVSAPYASPSSDSGLKTVRDRFLMSSGLRLEHLKRANQVLRAAKKDLYDVCKSKFLSKTAYSDMIAYLETFFETIEANDEVPTTLLMPASTD